MRRKGSPTDTDDEEEAYVRELSTQQQRLKKVKRTNMIDTNTAMMTALVVVPVRLLSCTDSSSTADVRPNSAVACAATIDADAKFAATVCTAATGAHEKSAERFHVSVAVFATAASPSHVQFQ